MAAGFSFQQLLVTIIATLLSITFLLHSLTSRIISLEESVDRSTKYLNTDFTRVGHVSSLKVKTFR